LNISVDGKPIEWRRFVTRSVLFTVLLAFSAIAAAPSARTIQDPVTDSGATFKSGVEVVTVTATVRDERGRIVKDLKRSDFEVVDAGVRREIKDFHAGEAAISVGLLIDISGSMAVGGNMDRARKAVAMAVGELTGGRDEAGLFTFDSELQQVRDFTTDLQRIASVSLKGQPWGTTSLYDAVGDMARKVGERTNRHRAVLVISDGRDTDSKLTAPEVSGIASAIDVPVYLVVVANPLDNPTHELRALAGSNPAVQGGTLEDLARWTGGNMAVVTGAEESLLAVRSLMAELRHQYLITFEPGTAPGWHPLEVRTRKKNLVVHARAGYVAGPGRSGS
jgi:Ca-activated chloride channel family protein